MQFRSIETYQLLLSSRFETPKRIKQGEIWVDSPDGSKEWKTKLLFTDALSRQREISFVTKGQNLDVEAIKDKSVYLLIEIKQYDRKWGMPVLAGVEIAKK